MGTIDASQTKLIEGLEAAISATPDNVVLRLHLAQLLHETGRFTDSLMHAEAVLDSQPDNLDACRTAASAATALGDPRAAAFAHVAGALEHHAHAHDAPTPGATGDDVATRADVWSGFVPPEGVSPAHHPLPNKPVSHQAAVGETDGIDALTPAVDRTPSADADAPQPPDAHDGEVAAVVEQHLEIAPEQIEHPRLNFANIIGVDHIKSRIARVVLDPVRRQVAAGRPPSLGGVLMFGPPGCGKGFFARTIAGELGAAYIPINMAQSMQWPGDPRDNIHRLFAIARAAAPCVLFLDDIDVAGRRPDAPDGHPDRPLLARLASELGNTAGNAGLLVFAGTTSPWAVDMALRVDGGLERNLLILPPDAAAREAILRYHLTQHALGGVDVAWVVERTQHFSGDDLLLLCEHALALAQMDALGDEIRIGPGHMTRALRDVRPTAQGWFSTVMEHALSASHGGMYDDAISYIEAHQLI